MMQQHNINNQAETQVKEQQDMTRAQIIALLHDNNITLVAIALANGMSDSTGLSIALTRGFPLNERRIAAALNVHPMELWPSRYNKDGTRKEAGRLNKPFPVFISKKRITKKNIEKKDLTHAQVVALLHDNNITLRSLAASCGLSSQGILSTSLRNNHPLVEQRVAAALNVHPMELWPSRYHDTGIRKSFQEIKKDVL